MKIILRCLLPVIALAVPLVAQQRSRNVKPIEVRAYLLDQDHQAASVTGVSALLVTEDETGKEKQIPMTIVTTREKRPKAPHCALRSGTIEGTPFTVAVCALDDDGRIRRESCRDEGGPKTFEGDRALDGPDGGERTVVDFDVPYFKAELPADHRCGPGCKMAIRCTIGGSFHTTRSFPCAAKGKSDLPTCCLHHQLVAECAELKRHLGANEVRDARDDLDRLSAGLERQDVRAKNEADRQDCIDQVSRIRTAIASDNTTEALAGADTLKDGCASSFPSCGGTEH